jgi:hypothetical protein
MSEPYDAAELVLLFFLNLIFFTFVLSQTFLHWDFLKAAIDIAVSNNIFLALELRKYSHK